ncbi:MAG: IPTL-CTERM sorting domain-containing protein [Acidobacteriota bacterium]|nr:IPTL-CTERM sorting domain-containing protein [Acidobacteriota bacterium]
MSFRILFISLCLLGSAAFAQSEKVFEIGIDRDNYTETGCDWLQHNGDIARGIDLILVTRVDRIDGVPTVTGVTVRECEGTGFGNERFVSPGGWPVATDVGEGTDALETFLPVTFLGSTDQVAVAWQASSERDTDVGEIDASNGTLLFLLPYTVPTLGQWGLLALVVLLFAAAVRQMRRNRKNRRLLAGMLALGSFILLGFGAGFMPDGDVGDWSGITPHSEDDEDDTSDENIDLVTLWVAFEDDSLVFRIDVADLENADPTGDDQSVTILEDEPITFSLTASDDDDDEFTFDIVTDPTNGMLSGDLPNITYTPDADFNGSDSFTFSATDDEDAVGEGTINITITPVNDAPSFTPGADVSIDKDLGPQTITGWASDISPGPSDESGQTVTFEVTANDNTALFSVQPAVSSSGDLTFTTAADVSGSAQVTIQLVDNGGTDNGGEDTSDPHTLTISISAVNDAPSFTAGANQTVNEDAGPTTVNGWATDISPGPADESGQVLTFNVTNNTNAALFAAGPAVDATTGDLTFTPADDANGTATITITLSDDGSRGSTGQTSPPQSFDIIVNAVNDAPLFTAGANESILKDTGLQTVPGWATGISPGPADESGQTVSFNVSNDNNALFTTQPAISADGTLTYTPTADISGTAVVSVSLSDDGGTALGGDDTSDVQMFNITIGAVNDPPSFTAGADQTVNEDAGPTTVNGWATNISPGPADESGQVLTFNVTDNTNAALFSAGPAVDATTGDLSFTPAADANGTATITITLSDDGTRGAGETSPPQSFDITVNAVNDAPAFTAGADETVNEDAGAQTVNTWATGISSGPANESGQAVSFNVSNDNNSLFSAQPAVDSSGNLTYTPADDANGSAVVTISVSDDGGTPNGGSDTSADQTFNITVNAVNDAPSFSSMGNQSANEDSGAQTVNNWATSISPGPADESGQTVSFGVTNDNNGLFSAQPAIDGSGTLTYTPAAMATGSATVTVSASDDGGTANGGDDTADDVTFTITIDDVNDEPTFTIGADQSVNEDSGAQSVGSWIADGNTVEAGQTISYDVSNDANTLFAVQPSVDASGTLTYTPADDAFGSATVTVIAMDDGGTANGGDDTSDPQTATITVNAVNDEPGFTAGVDQSVAEDVGAQTVNGWATGISNGPANEGGQTPSFNVSNDNNALFSAQPAIDASGNLTYTPEADANGTATVTVSVSDDGGTGNGGTDTSADQTFNITVTAVNDAPSFTSGGNVSSTGTGVQTESAWATSISAGPADESGQVLTFNVTGNTDNSLFDVQPAVDAASGDLTYTVAMGATGTSTITLNLSDDGGGDDTSADVMFTITVAALNNEPTFTAGADETVNEDIGAQTVNGWATAITDNDGNTQVLTFAVTNDNNSLFSAQPDVDETTGNLTYTPAADAFGSATVSVTLSDDGGTAGGGDDTSPTENFTITVNPVNDEPSFTLGADETVLEDAGAQTVNGWATDLDEGATNESSQTLSFNVSNDNNALFSAQPAIDASGNLTYTPANDANGSATVTVSISDDGGTPNGGDDTSPDQTFTITVTAVNDLPTVAADAYSTSGNTHLVVQAATPAFPHFDSNLQGLLNNDSDPVEGSSISIVEVQGNAVMGFPVSETTDQGGSVSINSNGSFTYTPPAGFTGSDTFTYNIQDADGGNAAAAATVTLTVADMVWYVDSDNMGTADGRSGSPFTDFSSLQGAMDSDGTGDIIYVNTGTGSYTGGFAMEASQRLVGEGASFTLTDTNNAMHNFTLAAGTAPDITNAAGDVITMADGATVEGVNLLPTASAAISANGIDGGTVDDVTIDPAATSDGVDLQNCLGTWTLTNITVNSTPGSSGFGLNLTGSTGGSFTMTNFSSTDMATGITIGANTGSLGFGGTTTITEFDTNGVLLNGDNGAITFNTLTLTSGNGVAVAASNSTGALNVNGGTVTHNGASAGRFLDLNLMTGGGDLDAWTIANGADGMEMTNSDGTWSFPDMTLSVSMIRRGVTQPAPVFLETNATADVTLGALNLNNDAGTAFHAVNTGTLSWGATSQFSNSSGAGGGTAVYIDTCTLRAPSQTIAMITSNGARGLDVNNSSGTLNVTAATLNVSSFGINLNNNPSAVFNLEDVDVTAANNPALFANAGTVNIDIGNDDTPTFISGSRVLDLGSVAGTMNIDTLTSTNSLTDGVRISGTSATVNVSGLTDINNASAQGIDIGTASGSFTFANLDVDGASDGVLLTGNTGTVTISAGDVAGTSGVGVHINGGAAGVNIGASITNTAGQALRVENRTGGTGGNAVTLTGAISDTTAQGVLVQNNNSGTPEININGTVTVTNSTNTGVLVNGNTGASVNFGAVNVNNSTSNQVGFGASANGTASGTISSTGGTIHGGTASAVDIDNSRLGLSFTSLSSIGGASPGIDLNTTTGTFAVTGDGGGANNASGGTIQSKTGSGVLLNSAAGISLGYMLIDQNGLGAVTPGADGISGTSVTGLTVNRTDITGNGDSVNEAGIEILNLLGTCNVTNTLISGSGEHNFEIIMDGANVLTMLTIDNSTIRDNKAGTGADGLQFEARNTSTATLVVQNSLFTGNLSDGIQVAGIDSGNVNVTLTGNTIQNSNVGAIFSVATNADLTFDISDNVSFSGISPAGGNAAIHIGSTTTSTNAASISGTIDNNPINNCGSGVRLDLRGDVVSTVSVTDHVMTNINRFGVDVLTGDLAGDAVDLNLTVTGNSATTGRDSFYFETLESTTICLNVRNNTGTPVGGDDAFVIFDNTAGITLEQNNDCGGGVCANAAAQIAATNTGAPVTADPVTLVAAGTCSTPP